ncbi:MAG: phasin family protein [Burkholderiales bacterium]|nr:phasin family protein [Burkholderiales bacterium]
MRNADIKNAPATGTVRHVSRQIWLAGLGAAALTRDWAESGAGPMFRSLVKEGTLVEARTIRVVGDRLETSYAKVNSVWRRTRAVVQSGVRDAADSAVSLVQKTLPRSLPQVKLPAMAVDAPARKTVRKTTRKHGVKKATAPRTARVAKRGVRGKARAAK